MIAFDEVELVKESLAEFLVDLSEAEQRLQKIRNQMYLEGIKKQIFNEIKIMRAIDFIQPENLGSFLERNLVKYSKFDLDMLNFYLDYDKDGLLKFQDFEIFLGESENQGMVYCDKFSLLDKMRPCVARLYQVEIDNLKKLEKSKEMLSNSKANLKNSELFSILTNNPEKKYLKAENIFSMMNEYFPEITFKSAEFAFKRLNLYKNEKVTFEDFCTCVTPLVDQFSLISDPQSEKECESSFELNYEDKKRTLYYKGIKEKFEKKEQENNNNSDGNGSIGDSLKSDEDGMIKIEFKESLQEEYENFGDIEFRETGKIFCKTDQLNKEDEILRTVKKMEIEAKPIKFFHDNESTAFKSPVKKKDISIEELASLSESLNNESKTFLDRSQLPSTLKLFKQILKSTLNDIRKLEHFKLFIQSCKDFSIEGLFDLARSKGHQYVTAKDLYRVLKELKMGVKYKDSLLIISRYDKDCDSKLNKMEFVEMMEPLDKTKILKNENFIEVITVDDYAQMTKNALKKLFLAIIKKEKNCDLDRILVGNKRTVETIFSALSLKKEQKISSDLLKTLLDEEDEVPNFVELSALIEKFDYDCDGLISFDEFLYEMGPKKYSSPKRSVDLIELSNINIQKEEEK